MYFGMERETSMNKENNCNGCDLDGKAGKRPVGRILVKSCLDRRMMTHHVKTCFCPAGCILVLDSIEVGREAWKDDGVYGMRVTSRQGG